jgi:hypothetical protein
MSAPFWAEHGFPRRGPGWFNGYVGPLYVSLAGRDLDLAGARAFIDTTVEAVDFTPDGVRMPTLTLLQEGPWFHSLGLREKTEIISRYSSAMNARREKIRRIIPVTGNVLGSLVTRTVLRTVSALAPAPCPQVITGTAKEALHKMRIFVPEIAEGGAALLGLVAAVVEKEVASLAPLVVGSK